MPGDVCDRLSEIIYRKTIKFICFSDFIVYICNAEPETNAFTMETECVIRIAPPVYAGGVREDRSAYDTNL